MSDVTVITEPNASIYGLPTNLTFTDVWESETAFYTDYTTNNKFYTYDDSANKLTEQQAKLVYYLLYSRYGNSSIASRDTTRFKYNVYDIIFQYAPAWIKKLDIQKKVRALTDAEVVAGTTATNNHAYNPGTAPSTATLTELTAINEQTTQKYTKGKLDGYMNQWAMINNDVTEEFIRRFKKLFTQVVAPLYQLSFEAE